MAVSKENKDEFVSRVSQLDAKELDTELFSLLKSELLNCFQYIKPDFLSKFEPEVNALLRLILWKFALHSCHATVGQQLFQLQYCDSLTKSTPHQWKTIAFAVGLIGTHYLQERTPHLSIFFSKYPRLKSFPEMLDWIEVLLKAASIINFIVFIQQGHYLTLLDRALGLKSSHSVPPSLRQVGYEYMTRELLWHGFAEFLAFILPFFRGTINNFFNPMRSGSNDDSNLKQNRTAKEIGSCGICENVPCLPHEIGCKHVFCYYCISIYSEANNKVTCPVCGFTSESINYLVMDSEQ